MAPSVRTTIISHGRRCGNIQTGMQNLMWDVPSRDDISFSFVPHFVVRSHKRVMRRVGTEFGRCQGFVEMRKALVHHGRALRPHWKYPLDDKRAGCNAAEWTRRKSSHPRNTYNFWQLRLSVVCGGTTQQLLSENNQQFCRFWKSVSRLLSRFSKSTKNAWSLSCICLQTSLTTDDRAGFPKRCHLPTLAHTHRCEVL